MKITYIYTATGEKLAEISRSADGLSDLRRDYYGPFEFTDGSHDRTNYPQGYMDCYGYFYAYIPDYQGNILGIYNAATGWLDQFTDYYPYGQPHPDCTSPELNRRKFGAKELTTTFGLNEYDFAARRLSLNNSFTQPDPLAGKYPSISPYAYCAADPINLTDPTGETVILSGDDDLIERTIKYLNIGLGLDRNIFSIDKDNRIVVNENLDRSTLTDAQYMLYSTIQKAANDETITVAMNIVENSNEIYVGDAYTATVDLADAEVLTKSGLTSTHSIIMHEINEQYQWIKGKLNGKSESKALQDAHVHSLFREGIINGVQYFYESKTNENGNPDLIEPFTHNYNNGEFRIVIKNGAGVNVHYIDTATGKINRSTSISNEKLYGK